MGGQPHCRLPRVSLVNVKGKPMRTIWVEADGAAVGIIDQTRLPHEFVTRRIETAEAMAEAIRTMRVRGAPLIGAAAAYGVALTLARDSADAAYRGFPAGRYGIRGPCGTRVTDRSMPVHRSPPG